MFFAYENQINARRFLEPLDVSLGFHSNKKVENHWFNEMADT